VTGATTRLDARAANAELERIAHWWLTLGTDGKLGGFAGEIGTNNRLRPTASKGAVLTCRILWFFSNLYLRDGKPEYHEAAERAWRYLAERFVDHEHGGIFWELHADGRVLSDRKQIYALAFAIYACAAWHRAGSDPAALDLALSLFEQVERHARDLRHGGYLEAFSRSWGTLRDLRLGGEDLNAPKSTNTHLHLLEAYTSLYLASGSAKVSAALQHLLGLFRDRIAVADETSLGSFFDSRWNRLDQVRSFGHEIEASWLLWEAAAALADAQLQERTKPLVLALADGCLTRGSGPGGRLCEKLDLADGSRSETSVWWVQAEALVGYLNAWEVSGEPRYRSAADSVWAHILSAHIDSERGEWFWFPPGETALGQQPYKAGFWKAPYHNGRAMLECARRLSAG